MQRGQLEVAHVIERFLEPFKERCTPNAFQLYALSSLLRCRTSALGGHAERCDCCGKERISYNSCRNRHCPKCQASSQMLWVDDCIANTLKCRHFHIVFTVPEELNAVALHDSGSFYQRLFESVWDTLRPFAYTHYGVETGAICILHTWGQNLSLHPHVHCIVPAAGLDLRGKLKRVGANRQFLFPVRQLSAAFRTSLLRRVKADLKRSGMLDRFKPALEKAWARGWVVHCQPSLGSHTRIIGYLGQYTHRVAISNDRILGMDDRSVTFSHKDYADNGKQKVMTLDGVEFLRRFCLHILPRRFVKIRRYGIYGNRYKRQMQRAFGKDPLAVPETRLERIRRVLKFDPHQCPFCRKGRMVKVDGLGLPRTRSPDAFVFAPAETFLA